MKHYFRIPLLALCAVGISTLASAKLPAPSPAETAKAAEAAAKSAWSGKADVYKLCLVQDRVAARFGKTAPTATTPGAGCMDPGPFAYTPPEAKPIEASEAHSPPGTASSPPSTQTPTAAMPTPAAKP